MTTDILGIIKTVGLVLGYLGSLAVLAIFALTVRDGVEQEIVNAFVQLAMASAIALGALRITDQITGYLASRNDKQLTTTAITTAGAQAADRVLNGTTLGNGPPHPPHPPAATGGTQG